MTDNTSLCWDVIDTPIGRFGYTWSARGLTGASFKRADLERMRQLGESTSDNRYRDGFRAYFAGRADALAALPLDLDGTGFQMRVWRKLLEIPAGETRSYSDLAQAIGMPFAVRAVGAANGQNPVAVAVPCHRVVGKNGQLTGYAGGLKRKAWLLAHERRSYAVAV